jgi:hypothetical protein
MACPCTNSRGQQVLSHTSSVQQHHGCSAVRRRDLIATGCHPPSPCPSASIGGWVGWGAQSKRHGGRHTCPVQMVHSAVCVCVCVWPKPAAPVGSLYRPEHPPPPKSKPIVWYATSSPPPPLCTDFACPLTGRWGPCPIDDLFKALLCQTPSAVRSASLRGRGGSSRQGDTRAMVSDPKDCSPCGEGTALREDILKPI